MSKISILSYFFSYIYLKGYDYMKQIIPFKKELLFKTKVSEITSISLEHTLSLKKDDLISGEFHISGDYKMTEGSINREKFYFTLPFEINLDTIYNTDTIIIDIDNFYYEVINNESLQVNIDVYVEGEKIEKEENKNIEEQELIETISDDSDRIGKEELIEKDDSIKEIKLDKEVIETNVEDNMRKTRPIVEEEVSLEESIKYNKPMEVEIESEPKIEINNNNTNLNTNKDFNIFDNIDSADTYVTYYVYIVKEEDNIDKILEKFNVTKEELANYNDITNIKPKDKLIIPSHNE